VGGDNSSPAPATAQQAHQPIAGAFDIAWVQIAVFSCKNANCSGVSTPMLLRSSIIFFDFPTSSLQSFPIQGVRLESLLHPVP